MKGAAGLQPSPRARRYVARIAAVTTWWMAVPRRCLTVANSIWCWWWSGSGAPGLAATGSGFANAGSGDSSPSWTENFNLSGGSLRECGGELREAREGEGEPGDAREGGWEGEERIAAASRSRALRRREGEAGERRARERESES